MRTTIRINDTLLKSAKEAAVQRNISLTRLVEDALREMLYGNTKTQRQKKIQIVTYKGNGLNSGVDLDDSASLLDTMES